MKTLQNNFTTPEQSKKLLELGVPADSADCCYSKDANRPLADFIRYLLPEDVNYSVRCSNHLMYDYIPCWSVGRLIELIRFCTEGIEIYLYDSERPNMVMCLVKCIEKNISDFDFSKLEE